MAKQPEPGVRSVNFETERNGILLVDDTPANLVALRAILDEPTYDLVEARSGEEALQRLIEREFAVILLDVRIPGLSGFDTAKLIRADDSTRTTPIIFLTAHDIDRAEIEAGYALGAVDFFVKPLSPIIVQAKVRGLVTLFQQKERAKQEAEQLRLIVQGTTDYAIFMLDPHGRVATWNSGAERIKGYKADEIIGQHFSKFYPQDVIDRGWPEHELKVATAEGRFEDEGWRLRKDGSRFWANVVITALRDEQGELRGFSKVTRDLTERKQAEEALRRSEERFRLIVESAKDYAIFLLDPQGHIASWNPGAERIKGYKAEEIIGQHFSKFYPQEANDRRWPEHELKVAAAEGRFEDEGWRVRKDGSQFWANVIITALKDEHGELRGFSKITRDLTERKEGEENARRLAAEQAARKVAEESEGRIRVSEERLRLFVEHAPAAVAMFDRNMNYLLVSQRWLLDFRLRQQDILGRSHYEVFPDIPEEWKEVHRRCLAGAVERCEEDRYERTDGQIDWLRWEVLPWTDAQGEIGGILIFSEDISERKRADEAVKQQREWLSVTLASIGDAVIATDAEGRITFLNGVAEHLTGWILADARNHSLETVFRILHEKTRQPVENPVEKVLRDGVIVGLGNHTVLIAKDGTERPIDDSAAPIRDSSGQLIGVVLVFRDVTEQRQAEWELRASEARKSAVLESALDCIITMDHEGKVVEFNPACERTFGYSRDQVIGQELCSFIIPASLRQKHREGMAHYLKTGEGPVLDKRLELPALRADGTEFPAELSITRITSDGPPLFTAYLRDISQQKRSEQYRNARLGVTSALTEADTLEEGAKGVLKAVCDNLGWDVGFVWTVNEEAEALVCRQSWHQEGKTTTEFETASCRRTFAKEEGLPGRVWATGKSAWILDFANDKSFPRAAPAAKEGLHSAVGCPLIVGEQTIGVIEFFTHRLREPDPDLVEIIGTVAGSLGQFIERTSADLRRREIEHRLQAVFNQQFQFMAILDPKGTVVEANETCFTATGFRREEVIGRKFWETPWWNNLPEMQRKWRAFVAQVAAGSAPVTAEMQYALSDGTIRLATTVVSGLKGDGDQIVNVVVEGRDITEAKQQEQSLRESEEKLRLLANTIPQLAWMAKPDGHIFWYNRRWFEYTGTTPEQMEGWGWQSVHDPAVLPQVVERWKSSLESGEPFDMVFPLRGADGQYRPFLTRVNPLKNGDGQILYWFGTNTDITELRQAREALADSEERLRLALDAGRMGVWDWNIRTGDLKWSDSLEPLHGLAPGTFGGTFEHFQSLIYPDDQEQVNAAIRQALEGKSEFYVEFRNVRQNGATHWIAGSGKVFPGDDGQPLRMIGVGMEVTHRRRAEQTARFLADASAALAVLVDFDSTLQKVASLAVPHFADWVSVDVLEESGVLRRVAVAHVDPTKVQLAHDLHRRFPPDPTAPSGVWNILRTGQAEIVPQISDDLLVASVKDDELLGITRELGLKSYLGVPLTVRGKTLGVLTFIVAESGHVYDETDLAVAKDLASRAAIAIENTQLYRELRDADRRKDEFLATLAHELRNPLAPIRNGLQVLRLAGGGGEMGDEARSMMERQLTHMVRLVDDLLDVSRITRNKLELRRERVALATVIHTAVETSRPMIEQFGHTFSVTLAPVPVYLDADPVRMAQVFSNLLTNSAKYTEPGGKITLVAEADGGEAVIRVRDNGLGIPIDAQPRIFEMFSQVDRNIERSQGGLGIGLTLVKRLTEMHGGRVEVTSNGPGTGSEFTVRIPVLKEIEQRAAGKKLERGTVAGQKRRILVVDDNRDSAASLSMMLKLMGNETRTAGDGRAAIEEAETYCPEMILMDIGLPKLNGYDACRQIREQPWSKGMVLVALTGWGQEEDRRRSQDAGFDYHLVKPVDLDTLNKLLRQVKR